MTHFLFYKKPSKSLFRIFFLSYFTSRNSRYQYLQVKIMKKLKLLRCPKTKRSQYGLRKKFSEVSEFSILPYTQIRNLWNLGNMSFPSNSDSSYKSRFKNDKNMNWAKNRKVPIWLKRKNKNFRGFRVFDSTLHPKSKTRKSWKVLF